MNICTIRRFLALSAGALLATAATGTVLASGSYSYYPPPIDVDAYAAQIDDTPDIRVSFEVEGLSKYEEVTVTAKAHAKATFQCRNNGGHCPPAANKTEVVEEDVRSSDTFDADRYGKVEGYLDLYAPEAPDFCPPGLEPVLVEVDWTNIRVKVDDKASAYAYPNRIDLTFPCEE